MKKSLLLSVGALGVSAFLPFLAMAANDRYTPPKSADAQCMQTTVTKRGDALVSAFKTFNDSVTGALKDRAAAESKAWGETDMKVREKALREASQTFDKAYSVAARTLDKQKNEAWQQFERGSRACKGESGSNSSSSSSSNSNSSQSCNPTAIDGARGVYVQCYDGTEMKRSADSCQTSETWMKIGAEFCTGHCSKESGKCGVNTYSALELCSRSCPTPGNKCVAYCPDGTPYNSCVQYFADPCMNHSSSSSSSQPPVTVSEQVKCVFDGSSDKQACYGFNEKENGMTYTCSGTETCVVDVKGAKGASLVWKSSCGGYAYTTMDGTNENAKFACRTTR